MNNFNKKQKVAILISFISLLAICFCVSYFLSEYLTNKTKISYDNKEKNKNVYSEKNIYLDDNIYITLKTKDTIDMTENLINLKNKLKLNGNFTKEELSDELSKSGYILSEWDDNKLIYTRTSEITVNTLEGNKYYLGEENGYISLFQTDSQGNIIELGKKIYSESKPISNLPEIDQSYIKENRFSFDTKEEALQKLSEMIS